MQTARQQLLNLFHVQVFIHRGHLLQGGRNNAQITAQLTHDGRDLLRIAQHLHRLRVRIVPHTERALNGVRISPVQSDGNALNKRRNTTPKNSLPSPHLLLRLLERVRVVVRVLVRCDDALLLARHLRIEALDLVRRGDCVLQLRHRRKQPGPKHLKAAILLTAQPKLDREEVQRRQLVNILLGRTERSEPNLLRKLRKARVG